MSKFKSLLLLFGSLIILSGCSNVEVLNPKGPVASDSKFLIMYSIIFMLVIIAAVLIMFTLFLFKYRLHKTEEAGKMHHSALMETIWFIIPVIIVIALAIPTVKSLYMYEAKPDKQDDPLVVYATSAGYKWFFSYPDEKIETVNHLTIPKDRPVVFKLQSMDMMTSFWIPQLGGQKYAMTGMTMDWTLTASEEGTFRGRNSNFNGEGFARQTFDVNSVSQSKFKDWVKDAQSQKELDQDTFDKQLLPTTENKNLTFSGTHMAFVDPAADPEYIFHAYDRFNYVQKDPNFNTPKEIKEDVLDKPNKPARKPQITNANYERHGMKAMILGNNEPYNSEFKDEESHNMDEMEKISEGAKDEEASKAEKKDHEHGGGH
ncbi:MULTISPECIES: cytochrome aa3 quinol oxidase subunit II [Staphylococcus]|uniref:Probable quinol oxidase subunit 2 n=1 Tax=Staphylococcus cohnii TaxID=29382 RepID=A0A2T4LVJ9_9STAP|nr:MULTISPECIES: cytochrome aa3 quinol oxidase subunit II [Staphylococcus]MBA1352572.1 cytochrome aa3 quinol oxidase subunit II [Staphylococcus cohnii]MBA1391136.1 cytochrome aa3 quinol oxidase subunit II [Staphylococcus cohnii]MBB2507511.1 putative quinol oxidase subunit 2 [Staphylococcus cohnii subsp. barensis]MCE5099403.1 cytochrome aa3 quinol oxidase subunit II [Staphylococcus cohnii]MSU29309.1 cytochrome aa3 quinol oxidase subunit II [Staphylococcus sp. McC-251-APC-3A2]